MTFSKPKLLFTVCVITLVGASGIVLTSSRTPPSTKLTIKNGQEAKQVYDNLPLIISQVKDLEVVKAELKNKGTSDAYVVLEIKNKSDKAIIAISIETGESEEASGITLESFNGDDPPQPVIKPHDSKTIEFFLSNSKPGDPIRISGVMYADESEEGEKTSLETIRSQKENAKTRKPNANSSPRRMEGGRPQ